MTLQISSLRYAHTSKTDLIWMILKCLKPNENYNYITLVIAPKELHKGLQILYTQTNSHFEVYLYFEKLFEAAPKVYIYLNISLSSDSLPKVKYTI